MIVVLFVMFGGMIIGWGEGKRQRGVIYQGINTFGKNTDVILGKKLGFETLGHNLMSFPGHPLEFI